MTKEEKQKAKEHQSAPAPNIIELEEKAKLVDEYLDQMQRIQADFENYRKRVIKEKDDFRKYALEDILFRLLDVVDNMERAIESASKNHSYESLTSGINIVEKQFIDILRSQGVKLVEIKSGDIFDPHKHHAVSHENSEEFKVDTVIKLVQNGYAIGDRILRPAMVIVSNGSEQEKKP